MRRNARQALPAALLALAMLGGWELYVELAGVQADLLPAPHDVASALWNSGGLLLRNFRVTAEECPRIGAKFLEEERRHQGAEKFAQEYECGFVDNGMEMFDSDLVTAVFVEMERWGD